MRALHARGVAITTFTLAFTLACARSSHRCDASPTATDAAWLSRSTSALRLSRSCTAIYSRGEGAYGQPKVPSQNKGHAPS